MHHTHEIRASDSHTTRLIGITRETKPGSNVADTIEAFAPALVTYLTPFLLSSADLPSDTQAARIRLLSIPSVLISLGCGRVRVLDADCCMCRDYFANFKGATTELAPFLGGSMVAKVRPFSLFPMCGAAMHMLGRLYGGS